MLLKYYIKLILEINVNHIAFINNNLIIIVRIIRHVA